jgi:hypothetical protein
MARRNVLEPAWVFAAPLRGPRSVLDAAGVNAKRCSTAEQVEHVKKRCSYPGARIMLVRMIFAKCMSAPQAIQRVAARSAESYSFHRTPKLW